MGVIKYIKRKRRIKKRHRSYGYPKAGISRFRSSNALPIIKLCSVIIGVAGIVLLSIFVVVPFVDGLINPKAQETVEPKEFETPLYEAETKAPSGSDMSSLQQSAMIKFDNINDPFMSGKEIVFSTSTVEDGVNKFDKLEIYNTDSGESTEVKGIEVKYDNILSPKITDDYLLWIDSNEDGGGRICAYDRSTKKQFLIKEYAFAVPTINIYGDLIVFMQQAGDNLDRLYMYNLRTRESVAVDTFSDLPSVISAADISKTDMVYAVPYKTGDVIKSKIYTYSLKDGAKESHDFDRYVYEPETDGKDIVFTTTNNGPRCDLYVSKSGGEPELIQKDVQNYEVGDGFVAFTKDEAIYIYMFDKGKTAKISSEKSRGLLASVNKNEVCWYDVTGGYLEIDVVKYAVVEWES